MQRYLLTIGAVIIISIGISIYAINNFNNPKLESMEPIEAKVKDIVDEPERYDGKKVIVSGVITRILNGHTIYTLWDDNRMIELGISDELKRDLKFDTSVKVEGIVKIDDNNIWIDVEGFEYI